MLASVDSAKALRRAISRNLAAREQLRQQQQLALQEKLKKGLGGQKIGKHKVPEGEIDVQLGEELSESLRGLKVSFCMMASGLSLTVEDCVARGQLVQGSVHQHAAACAH